VLKLYPITRKADFHLTEVEKVTKSHVSDATNPPHESLLGTCSVLPISHHSKLQNPTGPGSSKHSTRSKISGGPSAWWLNTKTRQSLQL